MAMNNRPDSNFIRSRHSLLHIITSMEAGGAQRALFNLLSSGLAEKYDCYVISLMRSEFFAQHLSDTGVSYASLNMKTGYVNPYVLVKIGKLVREIGPHIVQGWMYHGNVAAYAAIQMMDKRPLLFWNVRNCLYEINSEKILTRWLIRMSAFFSVRADRILYNSHLSRKQHERHGFCASKSYVIPNGVDLSRFYPEKNKQLKRREWNLPSDSILIGHIARYHKNKDHRSFFIAAREIAKRDERVSFVMLGHGVNKDNAEWNACVPVSLRNRFHMLGLVKDVPAVMRLLEIFCLSSISEAFPNVLLEAMASGVYCVGTRVGDVPIVLNGYGELVEPGDIEGLIHKLSVSINMSQEERSEKVCIAREHAQKLYSLGFICQSYVDTYEAALT